MKLHLPKLLFTAVIAAVCCAQQVTAATYIFTPGSSVTNGTPTAFHNNVYTNEEDASDNEKTYSAFASPNTHILKFTKDSSAGETSLLIDFDTLNIAGLEVASDSNVKGFHGGTNKTRSFVIGKEDYTSSSSFGRDFTFAPNVTLTMKGNQTWTIADGKTVTLNCPTSIVNDGTTSVTGGTLSISGTITNNGTLTLNNTGIAINSLGNFERNFAGGSYAVSGSQTVDVLYSLYKGNAISGVTGVTYNNETKELNSNGQFAVSRTAYVVADGDTVTVGGSSPTTGAGEAALFALADTGTLEFADTQSSNLVKDVIGSGRVEVTLLTPTSGHGRGVKLGSDFHGTLAVNEGWMDLTSFTTASDATLELHAGQHWSNGGTLAQDIDLKATTANEYVFRNSGTLTLTGTVTGKYLDLGTTATNSGTLVLSGQGNAIEYVTIGTAANTMSLTVAEDMAFTRVSALKSNSTVTVNNGKTMTLNGGTTEGDNASTIGTLSAGGATLALGAGVQLTLGAASGASTSAIGTLRSDAAGNTIYLNAAATLNSIGTVDGSAKLNGKGTYNLGAATTMTSGVSLADTWEGSVKVTGTVSGSGNSATLTRYQIGDLEALEDLDTTDKGTVTLSGVKGHFIANKNPDDAHTFSADIVLENYVLGETSHSALQIDDGYSIEDATNRHTVIDGSISGYGDLEYAKKSSDAKYLVQGDVSDWHGTLKATKNTLYLVTGGEATSWDAAIIDKQGASNGGTIYLSVDNFGKTTTFAKEVSVSRLTVTDGSTAKFTATDETSGDSKLSVSGDITLGKGAALDVTGSITLNANNIRLADGITFDSTDAVTLVTVTGGTLTVNNVDTWTGSTYEIDGKSYTTSLSVVDNSLKLNFSPDKLDVYVTMQGTGYVNGKLTLAMVDAQGNAINTKAGNYNVIGLYGDAEWDDIRDLITDGANPIAITLQGAEGFTIVGSGDTDAAPEVGAGNVSFYGKYYGEAGGTVGTAGSYNPNYIPEPTTAALSLLALAGLAARRRRNA